MAADSDSIPSSSASLRIASSVFGGAGDAALALVRHVPAQIAFWALLGLLAGLAAAGLSLLLAALILDGGAAALLRGWRWLVPALLPPAGLVALGVHGFHRGTAQAALALEAQWSVVAQSIDRVFARIDPGIAARLANLPLAQAETQFKQLVRRALGDTDEAVPRRGPVAWALRRVRRLLAARIEAVLLAAYRAEAGTHGAGGGVDLAKVRDHAVEAVTARLRESLLGPLDGQLWLLLFLLFGLGIGGHYLAVGLLALLR
ncbi:hypothetical protein [Tahibacter caeni]|uniref:hypothetical protein n=1 Tax=Tahibacter caeni TaxID=1453545 RepID=UPI002148349A|nr:hypothetical protein [Tahibacter caeni]